MNLNILTTNEKNNASKLKFTKISKNLITMYQITAKVKIHAKEQYWKFLDE